MKRLVPIFIVALCLAGVAGTLWFLWSKSKPRPVPTRVEGLELKDIVKKTVATGGIVPHGEGQDKPRVPGLPRGPVVQARVPAGEGDGGAGGAPAAGETVRPEIAVLPAPPRRALSPWGGRVPGPPGRRVQHPGA